MADIYTQRWGSLKQRYIIFCIFNLLFAILKGLPCIQWIFYLLVYVIILIILNNNIYQTQWTEFLFCPLEYNILVIVLLTFQHLGAGDTLSVSGCPYESDGGPWQRWFIALLINIKPFSTRSYCPTIWNIILYIIWYIIL